MTELNFLITTGFVLIVLGMFLVVFWAITRSVSAEPESREKKEEKIKGGGVILIGPIPVVFGSDKRSAMIAMILAIVILLLMIVFLK